MLSNRGENFGQESRHDRRRAIPQLRTSSYAYDPVVVANASNYDDIRGREEGGRRMKEEARVQPFSFGCELAQGSNQVRISGFANIPELYQRIADSFGIPVSQIMYCTLDTPHVNMSKLLGNQLSFNNVIYAHTRGQTKEVRFLKSAEALGLTVSDNKAGGVFVKRISNTGVLAKVLEQQPNSICPGDLIECINGRSFINSRHTDVVNYLRELKLNSPIVLRLISPDKTLLPGISKRHKRNSAYENQTIRFTATGAEITEALDRDQAVVLNRLAEAIEEFIGIADEELAQSIFDLECRSSSKKDFLDLLQKHYSEFNFPKRIIDEFWDAFEYYQNVMHRIRN